MNAEIINSTYKEKFWAEPDNREFWAEWARAQFVILHNPNEETGRTLLSYNIQKAVIEHIAGEIPESIGPKKKLSDKYDELVQWCKDNHLLQVSAEDIAEKGDFSYPTALKFIKDRPDLFFRIKKGLYEVRNPDIIRKEEQEQLQ